MLLAGGTAGLYGLEQGGCPGLYLRIGHKAVNLRRVMGNPEARTGELQTSPLSFLNALESAKNVADSLLTGDSIGRLFSGDAIPKTKPMPFQLLRGGRADLSPDFFNRTVRRRVVLCRLRYRNIFD